MKKLLVRGGNKISGEIEISGAKNATLPIMIASILTREELVLSNIPHVSDIATMANLLISLGVEFNLKGCGKVNGQANNITEFEGKVITLNARNINNFEASYDLVCKMRASILALGPLLARFGQAKISLPGGCAIGARPVDLHLKALEKMGAEIKISAGYVEAKVLGRLKGAEINFGKISVGGTQNILMAACLAQGTTTLNNAAREPEIVDLANCLQKMGAKISGAGTSQIIIEGVEELHGTHHHIIGDRIEAGSYAIAAGITDGHLIMKGISLDLLSSIKNELAQAGVKLEEAGDNKVLVTRSKKEISAVNIETKEHPGFPTDMQAQFMALMTVASGKSVIKENIFENRFMHIMELVRMGANIEYENNVATVTGAKELNGAEVMATDLRASVSLVLTALAASGQTTINRLYHLERGYERLAEKLATCGADIEILY